MPTLNDNKVLNEILESEKKYQAEINKLLTFLSETPVSDSVLNDLVPHLNNLEHSSTMIIKNIEDTLNMLTDDSVSEFERFSIGIERLTLMDSFYTHYSLYIPVFNTLQKVLQNSKGDLQEIDNRFASQNSGMGLISFAIAPIQRAMRYELLLKELLKSAQAEESIDERQTTIITTLYEKAQEENTKVNSQQKEIDNQQTQVDNIGYQFGDIIGGKYKLGDISKRIKFTLWGQNTPEDTTVNFELVDPDNPREENLNNN